MKPIASYLIQCNDRYNNKIDVDGKELIVNAEVSEKDHIYVNRIGVVQELPLINTGKIKVGDKVLVHHNVFRRWYNMRGIEMNTTSYYKDDLYIVNDDQIFAYNQDDTWIAMDEFIFVAPIESSKLTQPSGAFKSHSNHFQDLVGKVFYGDDNYATGAYIAFTPDSEYEFNVDDTKLYRVMKNQITFIWNPRTKYC